MFLTPNFVPRDLLTRPMEIAASLNPVTYLMESLRSLILDDLDWAHDLARVRGRRRRRRDHARRERAADQPLRLETGRSGGEGEAGARSRRRRPSARMTAACSGRCVRTSACHCTREVKAGAGVDDRFDRAVRRAGDDVEAVAEAVDRLVVEGVDGEPAAARDAVQRRAGVDGHGVGRLVRRRRSGGGSAMCWCSVPPRATFSACMPRQMASIGRSRSGRRRAGAARSRRRRGRCSGRAAGGAPGRRCAGSRSGPPLNEQAVDAVEQVVGVVAEAVRGQHDGDPAGLVDGVHVRQPQVQPRWREVRSAPSAAQAPSDAPGSGRSSCVTMPMSGGRACKMGEVRPDNGCRYMCSRSQKAPLEDVLVVLGAHRTRTRRPRRPRGRRRSRRGRRGSRPGSGARRAHSTHASSSARPTPWRRALGRHPHRVDHGVAGRLVVGPDERHPEPAVLLVDDDERALDALLAAPRAALPPVGRPGRDRPRRWSRTRPRRWPATAGGSRAGGRPRGRGRAGPSQEREQLRDVLVADRGRVVDRVRRARDAHDRRRPGASAPAAPRARPGTRSPRPRPRRGSAPGRSPATVVSAAASSEPSMTRSSTSGSRWRSA